MNKKLALLVLVINPECGRIQKENKMSKAKSVDLTILRDFYSYPATTLAPFGVNVSVNLDVTLFPNLPVTPAQLKVLADRYDKV